MSDPRNVAHNKKVKQEKAHQRVSAVEPKKHAKATTAGENRSKQMEAPATAPADQAGYEKSEAVLSRLKEIEFHSRANIEALAQLTLTIEDELKQKEFSGLIGDTYAAQNAFQAKIAELIQSYEAKVGTLRPSP